MCGIYAAVGQAAGDADGAARALRLLGERGPHGSAILAEAGATLGLARLAIVAPKEPALVHRAGRVSGVINGELYQHQALRARLGLDAAGSDQAVAVALFADGGVEALRAACGPVTAALFERDAQVLTLVRDRFGKRPLFVDVRGPTDAVRVASELKALLGASNTSIRFSRAAVVRFLSRGILEDDAPLVDGIESVPPGAVWRIDQGCRIERGAAPDRGFRPSGAVGLDVELLRASCARRLDGLEVDAAVLLSGGLDSGVVAALARGRCLPAYTMRIHDGARAQEDARDEVDKARAVAEALGFEQRVVEVEPPTFADMAACAWRLETPDAFVGFGVAHAYRTLARRLREDGVRVVVTGEGADELFLGYAWQRAQAAAQNGWRFPEELVEARAWAGASLASSRGTRALEIFLRARFGDPLGACDPLSLCRADALADARADQSARLVDRVATSRGAERRRMESLCVDLPMWPLRIADRMLMGGGIEPRAPFLDDELVDAALSAPAASMEREHDDKPALRELAAQLLPFAPPRKQGFAAWSWPGAAATRAWARALASEGTVLANGESLHALAARDDAAGLLLAWRLLVLEVTARQLYAAREGRPWRP